MTTDENLNVQFNENYFVKLRQINAEDLPFIERDLTFYEKVSLAFLLYGSTKGDALFILQKLLALHRNQLQSSDLLFNYTRVNPLDWKLYLVEALSTIKAYKVLRKLGFSKNEMQIVFLPHRPELTLFLHPVLKSLYFVCEALTPAEAGKMIIGINQNKSFNNDIPFYDFAYLEIFVLDWITKSFIDIGKWPNQELKSKPNLEIIKQYLKSKNKDSLKDILDSVSAQLYLTTKSKVISQKFMSDNLKNFENLKDKPTSSRQLNEKDSANSKSGTVEFQKNESYDLVENEVYIVRREAAGFVLIINQKKFYRELDPELQQYLPEHVLRNREGTDFDRDLIAEKFKSFGYNAVIKENLTHLQMMDVTREVIKRTIAFDSLIICILSHGAKGTVYGCNSISVEIEDIEYMLASSDELLDKPKFLIIQACQGLELQTAKMSTLEHDSPGRRTPLFIDIIKAFSTVPGFASVRDTRKGTWFIQTLCQKIEELGDRKDILDILTRVVADVSKKRGDKNQCMVPQVCSTLKKYLFLPKRY